MRKRQRRMVRGVQRIVVHFFSPPIGRVLVGSMVSSKTANERKILFFIKTELRVLFFEKKDARRFVVEGEIASAGDDQGG